MSTYDQYRQLRRECGYSDDFGYLGKNVWEGCESDSQANMLEQLRVVARARQADLDKYEGDHW